jgi:hypothetical protein
MSYQRDPDASIDGAAGIPLPESADDIEGDDHISPFSMVSGRSYENVEAEPDATDPDHEDAQRKDGGEHTNHTTDGRRANAETRGQGERPGPDNGDHDPRGNDEPSPSRASAKQLNRLSALGLRTYLEQLGVTKESITIIMTC